MLRVQYKREFDYLNLRLESLIALHMSLRPWGSASLSSAQQGAMHSNKTNITHVNIVERPDNASKVSKDWQR